MKTLIAGFGILLVMFLLAGVLETSQAATAQQNTTVESFQPAKFDILSAKYVAQKLGGGYSEGDRHGLAVDAYYKEVKAGETICEFAFYSFSTQENFDNFLLANYYNGKLRRYSGLDGISKNRNVLMYTTCNRPTDSNDLIMPVMLAFQIL